MDGLLVIVGIGALAGAITYIGAIFAERFQASQRLVNGALKFAAGMIMAVVAFSLMPKAVRGASYTWVLGAFFVGGLLYILVEYLSQRVMASRAGADGSPASVGLYVGILVDVFVDGVVIGIGATLSLLTGLVMALSLSAHCAPLAFVTVSTAKRLGMAEQSRRLLGILFVVAVMAGAILGYLVLRNLSLEARLVLAALVSGFLLTTVVQGMIPVAYREDEPAFAGVLFIGGLTVYGLMSLVLE